MKHAYRTFEYKLEENLETKKWTYSCSELSLNGEEKSRNWAVLTIQGKIDLYFKRINNESD